MPTDPSTCVVCNSITLELYWHVAAEMGEKGLIPTTDRYGSALSDIVRCDTCGHMQLERFPEAESLAEAYEEAESLDYIVEEAGQRRTAQAILEVIERFTQKDALLDLGCWVGFLLDEARLRGWEPTGVEPSEFASTYARTQLGLDVRSGDLLSADLPEGQFSAVFLGDVIEHLNDPGAALDRATQLLTSGGVLALALPDAGSRLARLLGRRWWSVLPTHVQYFSRSSIKSLLARHRFEVVELTTAPKSFSAGYYADRLAGYSRPLARAINLILRATGLASRQWAPDFHDRMLVIARPTCP